MIFKKQTEICHLLKLSGAGGYFQWNKPVHKGKKKKTTTMFPFMEAKQKIWLEKRIGMRSSLLGDDTCKHIVMGRDQCSGPGAESGSQGCLLCL